MQTNILTALVFVTLFLPANAQVGGPAPGTYYQFCCMIGPRTKLYLNSFEHDSRILQWNVTISGLSSASTAAGEWGANLRTPGSCAWVDRAPFPGEFDGALEASWLSETSKIKSYTTVFPGQGIQTHMLFPQNFATAPFASSGLTDHFGGAKFCIPTRSNGPGRLQAQSNQNWWINPPNYWGR